MTYCPTIFRQVLDLINYDTFQKIVKQYKGDYRVRKLSCWNHLACLLYAQLKQKTSLRDIQIGLEMQENRLYHLGITSIKRSSLSDANKSRSHKIYRDLFFTLLKQYYHIAPVKRLFGKKAVALDATIIQLCATLFPWSRFQKQKGGIKLHMAYDLDTHMPDFCVVSNGNGNERKYVKDIPLEPDSIVVFDRGYDSFKWFDSLVAKNISFITRTRKKTRYRVTRKSGHTLPPPDSENILFDKVVRIGVCTSKNRSSNFYRCIKYIDPESNKKYEFLTNNFELSAQQVADIYKKRWDIELFFKWMKQHLRIKSFLGTAPNAVLSQIWVALTMYLLLKLLKKQLNYPHTLLSLTRALREAAFLRKPLVLLFDTQSSTSFAKHIQIPLFGFP